MEILIVEGREIGKDVTFDDNLIIGRGEECDFHVNDKSVSRKHAKISRTKDNIIILDLQSRNGTYVNGVSIDNNEFILKSGDRIAIGEEVLEFRDKKLRLSKTDIH